MTTSTADAPRGVDNFDWLQAIDDHPDLTTEHLLAAYALLGVNTDLTEERLFWLLYQLETYGFLRHLLAGYALLGVNTDLTEERLFWLLYQLETYGFLRAEVVDRKSFRGWLRRIFDRSFEVRYEFILPEEIVPDSELEW